MSGCGAGVAVAAGGVGVLASWSSAQAENTRHRANIPNNPARRSLITAAPFRTFVPPFPGTGTSLGIQTGLSWLEAWPIRAIIGQLIGQSGVGFRQPVPRSPSSTLYTQHPVHRQFTEIVASLRDHAAEHDTCASLCASRRAICASSELARTYKYPVQPQPVPRSPWTTGASVRWNRGSYTIYPRENLPSYSNGLEPFRQEIVPLVRGKGKTEKDDLPAKAYSNPSAHPDWLFRERRRVVQYCMTVLSKGPQPGDSHAHRNAWQEGGKHASGIGGV